MTSDRAVILIVDDERSNITLLGDIFQDAYDLRVSTRGDEVQQLARDQPFDLILLDIMMPEVDGIEVCRRLKADAATSGVPVIFITASTDSNAIGEGFRAGAVDYISKPLNAEEVRARVRTHLDLASERAQLRRAYQELNDNHEQLKRAQSQLLQSEKMASIGILVAGIAHEINNPTNFVNAGARNLVSLTDELKTFLFKLGGDELTPEIKRELDDQFRPLHENLGAIQDGTERIKNIVYGLRTFSRAEEGEHETVAIGEGLKVTLNLVRATYRNQVEFDFDFQADPVLNCWPAQLNQVFLNLAINGCQAMTATQEEGKRPPPKLAVSTYLDGDLLAIRFKDNGPGMNADTIQRIFDPFFTTKPVGEGTGLGLSISFGIIEKHKGRIEVESTVGTGTTFTVLLPT